MSGKKSAPPAAPSEEPWPAPGPPPPNPNPKAKAKSGSSRLRRAFSWLRGPRRKKKKPPTPPLAGQPDPDAAPADGKKPKKQPKPKKEGKGTAKGENEKRLSVQYKAGDKWTDNAFFSTSRPPHLEELHLQAQAGLKSLQNQEKQKQNKRTWDHTSETSSLQSSRSSAEGDDVSIQSQTLSCVTETTSEDALSVRSEMIQRKGSTFRPHDSFPKSSSKGEKRRRERRTTVLGLPAHVQKELGLSNGYDAKKRPGSVAVRASPQPLVNGSGKPSNAVHIPTVDGQMPPEAVPEGGARVSLPALEIKAAADSALQSHIDRLYRDDSLLGRQTAAKLSPLARPKSLAVPWMTTRPASPELLSPVMSISPQGTYMSKIIPNAILPPLVDVIALSRDRVRTLSRCSLSTASPSPSVRSVGRFPPLARSREQSSSSDNWSHSQSTETIVSNTSTISSHGGSRKDGSGPNDQGQVTLRPEADQLSIYSSASGTSFNCAPGKGTAPASPRLLGVWPTGGGGSSSSGRASPAYSTGSAAEGSDSTSVRSDRSASSRSVSLRKMKKAPAPPRRTYSLHQKAQQLEAEGIPRGMGLPPKPDRRAPHAASAEPRGPSQSPSLAGEDDVFAPSSPSETGSLRSDSLGCSPDVSFRRCPLPADKQTGGLVVGPEAQALSSKHSSPEHSGRTMSPSSGYSSQSGTPTLHAKSPLAFATSPGKKRPQPKKPERVCSLQSPGLSVSSSLNSLSSLASDPAPADAVTGLPPTEAPSGTVPAPNTMDRFVIPPHPKVPAPACPPPTTIQPAEPRMDPPTVVTTPERTDKKPSGTLAKPRNGATPPPSPPPAYHPPPPPAPAKKADVGETPVVSPQTPSEIEPDASPDSQWPPPPPPVPDEPDLSMADFPPPDEAFFSLPTLSVAAEAPSAAAKAPGKDLPAGEPLANQRATPAEEDKVPARPPSFSMMVSSKIQQQGVLGNTPLPAPKIESQTPPPPPQLSAPVGKTHSSAPAAQRKTQELAPVQPNLKKPGQKETAGRHKSNAMPKEDASLPIVTPSLLQMVRLRSVNMETHGGPDSPDAGAKALGEMNGPVSVSGGKPGQAAPPKPIRKSLSLRVPHSASKEAASSNLLHNAVRLKASSLSSREAAGLGVAERKAVNRMTLPAFSAGMATSAAGEAKDGQVSPLPKSPASTASFIFAKSPKRLVIETPSSLEAHANLKKDLVAELKNVSGQRSLTPPGPNPLSSGKSPVPKSHKVPPPIAKKPSLGPGCLHGPRSPRTLGAEELSSPLPAPGERTKNEGSGGQDGAAGVRKDGSTAGQENSLRRQGSREEMA